MEKLKHFAEILTQLFAPSPTNLSSIWSDKTKMSMKSTRGVRWHSYYFNVNAALLHFSTLKEILDEFRTRKGVKTLRDYLDDQELVGYLVWTSLRYLFFYSRFFYQDFFNQNFFNQDVGFKSMKFFWFRLRKFFKTQFSLKCASGIIF